MAELARLAPLKDAPRDVAPLPRVVYSSTGSTDRPFSIVMRDGRVESIGFGLPPQVSGGARVLFSRGIPRR